MKLHNILTKKHILFLEGERQKDEIIDYLLTILFYTSEIANEGIKYKEFLSALLQREREQTTALGQGFAFPHARINNMSGTYTLLAVSKKGINFDSLDQKPVHFLIFTLVPRLQPGILLKIRAALLGFIMEDDNKEKILNAANTDEIWDIIKKEDINLDKEILAKDIMRPQLGKLTGEMTLYDAARELHRFHIDSLPIIDKDGNFSGILSCQDLFSYNLPNFFNNLHTISFIKHMDPFEKYFQTDTSMTIDSLKLSRKAPVISADATIMEIIFELSIKNHEFLYVVTNKKLVGVIDRYSIIDKVLISNFSGEKQ